MINEMKCNKCYLHVRLPHLFPLDTELFTIAYSSKILGTKNGGTVPYKAILGVGFPLHNPYIQPT